MEAGERGGLKQGSARRGGYGRRWAVLVGVSEYQAPSLHLRFAHRDVDELWKLLQTDRCGRFVPERARVLVNQQATYTNITRSLRSFLKQAKEDDLVLLHFSGHGARDPETRVPYFLPYDTETTDIAGTALPMREIMQSINESLKAKHVVLLMDTCHSAAVEGGRSSATAEPIDVESYLSTAPHVEAGFAILTSCEANEQSREDGKWGGGHGLFTHLVLEGMRGNADADRDGTVTVGELFDYVIEQTRKFGGAHTQHPRVGHTSFDRSLPLAITGGAEAVDQLEVGRALLAMAFEYNDQRRFHSAARMLTEADKRAALEGGLPEARMLAGIAHLGASDTESAYVALRGAASAARTGRTGCEDAGYYLGIALAMGGKTREAKEAFQKFAHQHPDRSRATLAAALPRLLDRQPLLPDPGGGRFHAILIGIGDYKESTGLPKLHGCTTDVELMRDLVISLGIGTPEDIVSLVDAQATHAAIIGALRGLEDTHPSDTVLVHFSGHTHTRDADTYLAPIDVSPRRAATATQLENAIGVEELDHELDRIPARRKLLILDARHHPAFVELASRPSCSYQVLLAASSREGAPIEHSFEDEEGRRIAGLLTYVLVQTLRMLGKDALWSEILPRVTSGVQSRKTDQTPLLIGSDEVTFLGGRRPFDTAGLMEMSLFGDRRARSADALTSWYVQAHRQLAEIDLPLFPDLKVSFCRALLAAGAVEAAALALDCARDWGGRRPDGVERAWCQTLAELRLGNLSAARTAFDEFARVLEDREVATWQAEFDRLLDELSACRPRVLLVGIDAYTGPEVPGLSGAASDALCMKEALIKYCNVSPDDIELLIDGRATTAAIDTAFRDLARYAEKAPAMFYFVGHASQDEEGVPTLLGSDARRRDIFDLRFADLAQIARNANMACIFDVDISEHENATRFVPRDLRTRVPTRDISFTDSTYSAKEPVGRITFLPQQGCRISRKMINSLEMTGSRPVSWKAWGHQLVDEGEAEFLGTAVNEPLFHNAAAAKRAEVFLHRVRSMPWRRMTEVLTRMSKDPRIDPRHLLVDLGTTYALLEEIDHAAAAFMDALAATPNRDLPEARYHLGRVLLRADKDLARAVSELESAAKAYPDDPAILYYLGAAIRRYFEKESVEKARETWQKYLNAGAPIGHRAEVEAFLRPTAQR